MIDLEQQIYRYPTYLQLPLVCRCKQTLDHTLDSSSAIARAPVDCCVPVLLSSIARKHHIDVPIKKIQLSILYCRQQKGYAVSIRQLKGYNSVYYSVPVAQRQCWIDWIMIHAYDPSVMISIHRRTKCELSSIAMKSGIDASMETIQEQSFIVCCILKYNMMNIYIHTYINTHTHIHTHTHTYIHEYIHTYMMYTNMHTYIHT